MDYKRITNDSFETKNLGRELADKLKPGDVVLLYGELGAGKTTFVQGLAKGLNIADKISSPTFVLQRNHTVNVRNIKNLNHIDLYRLEGQAEIESLGLSETLDESDCVTIIEWADRLSDFKPKQGYIIRFIYLGGDKREIDISKI